jgi:flavodoxin
MKPIIIYAYKGDNTEKIANEIVQELDCESIKVTQPGLASSSNLDNYDLIFVGTGIHYGNPNKDLVNYLKTIDLKKPKVFALFVTWGGAGKTSQDIIVKLKTILESKGHRVTDDCFVCYGGWNFLRRGHPNLEDFKAVKIWAKKTVGTIWLDFK